MTERGEEEEEEEEEAGGQREGEGKEQEVTEKKEISERNSSDMNFCTHKASIHPPTWFTELEALPAEVQQGGDGQEGKVVVGERRFCVWIVLPIQASLFPFTPHG